MTAMIASAFLLAGMGSIMFIARQVAYTPSDATHRTEAEEIVSQICDELRYATIVFQQTPQVLEFVVADRNADGAAEKIRYEWSGTPGDPLRKSINDGASVNVLNSVNAFAITLQQSQKTTTLTTTTDSAESVLLSNTTVQSASYQDIQDNTCMAQVINPAFFSSVPANALSWKVTKVDFYAKQSGSSTDILGVQIRSTGSPNDEPTSNVLGQASIAGSSTVDGWNTVTFTNPIGDLSLSTTYSLVFQQLSGSGRPGRIAYNDNFPTGVSLSSDGGAAWQLSTTRQMWGRIYGTYTTPGASYDLTRNYVSSVRIALQTGSQSHSRIDASAPLENLPELLSAYWRTDFDRDPTATNANGDSVADWALASGGTFDSTKLADGIWTATGAIETRPLADFTTTTTVEVCCRNTTVGGNGAVLCINADRQGGGYAPLLVYLQLQSDGTQTLTLNGKTSDSAFKQLFTRTNLSSGFVRYKLTILPANNLVNLQINDDDQGTYAYPTYTPSGTSDRYLTVYADTSAAEFDYVEARVGTN